jgi:hypothetical protein
MDPISAISIGISAAAVSVIGTIGVERRAYLQGREAESIFRAFHTEVIIHEDHVRRFAHAYVGLSEANVDELTWGDLEYAHDNLAMVDHPQFNNSRNNALYQQKLANMLDTVIASKGIVGATTSLIVNRLEASQVRKTIEA